MAGEFGNHSLYKNLGYFSLIGLLRLHCQLGDYHQALHSVRNVQLSKSVLANTRVPTAQISLYYYVGFCYLMTRRYRVSVCEWVCVCVFFNKDIDSAEIWSCSSQLICLPAGETCGWQTQHQFFKSSHCSRDWFQIVPHFYICVVKSIGQFLHVVQHVVDNLYMWCNMWTMLTCGATCEQC